MKKSKNYHFNEVIRASSLSFVIKLLGIALGYSVIFLISRNFGAEGVGLYSLLLSLLNILSIVTCLGLNVSIPRFTGQLFASKDLQSLPLLFSSSARIIFPLCLVTGISLSAIAYYLNIAVNGSYLLVVLGSLILSFMGIQLICIEYLRGLKHFKSSEIQRSVLRHLFFLGIFITFYNEYSNIELIKISFFSGALLSLLVGLILVRLSNKSFKDRSSKLTNGINSELIYKTSLPLWIVASMSVLTANIPILGLQFFSNLDSVGIFNVALKVAFPISLILAVINTIAAPKFSELWWSNEKEALQDLIKKITKLVLPLTLIPALTIIFFSEPILDIFGKEFIQGKISLILLVISQVINVITGSAGILLNMTGNEDASKSNMFASLIVTLISALILIPYWNVLGASISVLVGSVVLRLLNLLKVKQRLGLNLGLI